MMETRLWTGRDFGMYNSTLMLEHYLKNVGYNTNILKTNYDPYTKFEIVQKYPVVIKARITL